jgi:hypothetical protein
MADRYERHAPPPPWKRTNAFGLPPGSVRALLALMIAATVWGALVLHPGREVPAYLRDLMFIILGHYFAVRGRSTAPADAAEGAEPDEAPPPPLSLPRGTVRAMLVVGFVAVAVVLFGEDRIGPIGESPASVTLMLVFGFLLGALFRTVADRLGLGQGSGRPRLVEDLKATVALLAGAYLVALAWDDARPFLPALLNDPLPRLGEHGPEHLASALVGFYFGSR